PTGWVLVGGALGEPGVGRVLRGGPATLAAVVDGAPHPFRRAGHGDVLDTEVADRVHDRVDHGGGGGDAPRLADALGSQVVGRGGRDGAVGDEADRVRAGGQGVVDEGTGHQR